MTSYYYPPTDFEIALSVWSDTYKEARGFRPKYYPEFSSEDEVWAACDRLSEEARNRAAEEAEWEKFIRKEEAVFLEANSEEPLPYEDIEAAWDIKLFPKTRN